MSQARLPRTEPSTELITAHKGNNCDAHAAPQTRDFSALPKHRDLSDITVRVTRLTHRPVLIVIRSKKSTSVIAASRGELRILYSTGKPELHVHRRAEAPPGYSVAGSRARPAREPRGAPGDAAAGTRTRAVYGSRGRR